MQRNAEISAICLKRKESSQLFSSFFQDYMWFFCFKNIFRQPIWNLAGQQNSLVFLGDSYFILETNKPMKFYPKGVAQIVLNM